MPLPAPRFPMMRSPHAKIAADVAGTGLKQNATTGALEVDAATVTGDGTITSTDLTVTGGDNAAFNNVTLDIKDGAVTAAKLNAMGATDGQVLKYNTTTSVWEPATAASCNHSRRQLDFYLRRQCPER